MDIPRTPINWSRGLFRVWVVLAFCWVGVEGYVLYLNWPSEVECAICDRYGSYIVVKGAKGRFGLVERNTYEGQRIVVFSSPGGHLVSLDVIQEVKAEPSAELLIDIMVGQHRAEWQRLDDWRREQWRAARIRTLLTNAPLLLALPPAIVLLFGFVVLRAAPAILEFASQAWTACRWLLHSSVGRLTRWLISGFRYP